MIVVQGGKLDGLEVCDENLEELSEKLGIKSLKKVDGETVVTFWAVKDRPWFTWEEVKMVAVWLFVAGAVVGFILGRL